MHSHQTIDEEQINTAEGESGDRNIAASSTDNASLRLAVSAGTQKPIIDSRSLLLERQSLVLGLTSEFLDQKSFATSLTALCIDLQHRIRCDRVVLGLFIGNSIQIEAISQQSTIDPLSGEIRLLIDAMQEACDQDRAIHYPESRQSLAITLAHSALTAGRASPRICTIPLCAEGEILGAILFDLESRQGWSRLTISFMQQIAGLMSPLIELKRRSERSMLDLAKNRIRSVAHTWFKPERLAVKCLVVATTLFLLVAHFIPVTHQIKTTAEIAALEKRIIAAPVRGYVQEAHAKNGDAIVKGSALVKLDTRDLELERVERENDIRSAETELRASMASHDRKEMALSHARLDQAQAQIDLINKQISRSTLRAPVDGFILNGDLSQSLGVPVERGDTLFEIAPLSGQKAYLMVAESDIDFVRIGQTGSLTLKASPGDPLAIVVRNIHPIAIGKNGANRFRIEAEFTVPAEAIKPGQTGIAKLKAGETNFLWSISHKSTEWIRLFLWEWFG